MAEKELCKKLLKTRVVLRSSVNYPSCLFSNYYDKMIGLILGQSVIVINILVG